MKMRDPQFIAVHRGGLLSKTHHQSLATWAADCAEHLLPWFERHHPQYTRLRQAIATGRAWARAEVKTGAAMRAALSCHAAAREASDPIAIACARAAGHAVATAHAADHCLGVVIYTLKAFDSETAHAECQWQLQRLPLPLRDHVLAGLERKLPNNLMSKARHALPQLDSFLPPTHNPQKHHEQIH